MVVLSHRLSSLYAFCPKGLTRRHFASVNAQCNKGPHVPCPSVHTVMLELMGSVQQGLSAPRCGKDADILEEHVLGRSIRIRT
jgi:hypothetical protein